MLQICFNGKSRCKNTARHVLNIFMLYIYTIVANMHQGKRYDIEKYLTC